MATEATSISVHRARPRLPREQRRKQLIDAAATAFVRAGFDGTSMEDVAETAGVTRLIVYRIFTSKEELYRSVLESVTARLREEFADVEQIPARGGVAGIVLRVARERPDAFRLFWRHALHEPAFAGEAQAFRDIAAEYTATLIHPYLHDREFRRWAAESIVSHLYDGVCAWIDRGDPQRDDELVVRMNDGIRALIDAWTA